MKQTIAVVTSPRSTIARIMSASSYYNDFMTIACLVFGLVMIFALSASIRLLREAL